MSPSVGTSRISNILDGTTNAMTAAMCTGPDNYVAYDNKLQNRLSSQHRLLINLKLYHVQLQATKKSQNENLKIESTMKKTPTMKTWSAKVA
jgi:hypothetical protein